MRIKVSRMKIAVTALAASLAVAGLAGCSSDSADAPAEAGATVSTMFGDVEVPANPERVVALGWSDAETALALGTQPVGVADWMAFGGKGANQAVAAAVAAGGRGGATTKPVATPTIAAPSTLAPAVAAMVEGETLLPTLM